MWSILSAICRSGGGCSHQDKAQGSLSALRLGPRQRQISPRLCFTRKEPKNRTLPGNHCAVCAVSIQGSTNPGGSCTHQENKQAGGGRRRVVNASKELFFHLHFTKKQPMDLAP
mmetsp:Transcript_46891/g.92580  ORF Transcript_46891/g.92580 Transcript_46891/m.92580 type:complete len:114 (-) Transcript_46891:60-401(-)